jgi:hypothetical protein
MDTVHIVCAVVEEMSHEVVFDVNIHLSMAVLLMRVPYDNHSVITAILSL